MPPLEPDPEWREACPFLFEDEEQPAATPEAGT